MYPYKLPGALSMAATVFVVFVSSSIAGEKPPLRIEWTPAQITAPHGILGTKEVTFVVTNISSDSIELSSKQWLVVQSKDGTVTFFAPPSPYTPLVLESGQHVETTWHIAEWSNGEHPVIVHFRSPGEKAWRSQRKMIAVEESLVNWVIIIVACIASASVVGPVIVRWLTRK